MKKLLIAYDGSPHANAALDDLAFSGLPRELEVTVLSVADVWLPSEPEQPEVQSRGTIPDAVLKARARAQLALKSSRALAEAACDRLRAQFPQWNIHPEACADSPAWAIVTQAVKWQADLVLLGSHGRSPLERLFLGSVAQKVAAEAPCSVRIARPRPQPMADGLKLLVAVDGSGDSQAAVRTVAARLWPEKTPVYVVTVIDARLESATAWPKPYTDLPVGESMTADEWARRTVEGSAAVLRGAGLQVETATFHGEPKHILLREAERWQADCLFVGARGLHHGRRLFLGSLASAVAARAPCSVEIVRPPVAQQQEAV